MHRKKSGGASRAPLFLRLVTPALRLSKAAKLHPAPKNVFVLSTGRTGTVYLADLLNQLNGVMALHEPKPSRVLNAWTAAFLEGRVSVDFMATALANKRRKTLRNAKADIYVESNNFIAGFADALEKVFEEPVIIHIVRDPRDFATSLTNRGDDAGIRKFFNKFVPYWAYVPHDVEKRELSALTRAAYRWVAVNEYLSDYGRAHPNYHFFKFEEAFNKHDRRELVRLLEAVGLSKTQIAKLDFTARTRPKRPRLSLLDRPTDSANRSKHATMKPWRQWSDNDKLTLNEICGPLMQAYGYGNEPEWRKSVN